MVEINLRYELTIKDYSNKYHFLIRKNKVVFGLKVVTLTDTNPWTNVRVVDWHCMYAYNIPNSNQHHDFINITVVLFKLKVMLNGISIF